VSEIGGGGGGGAWTLGGGSGTGASAMVGGGAAGRDGGDSAGVSCEAAAPVEATGSCGEGLFGWVDANGCCAGFAGARREGAF
jgi:hypothetical protein